MIGTKVAYNMSMISIIIPTINRKKELVQLLDSIDRQNYKNFEVIIVDQNPPGYLDSIVHDYSNKFKLKHIVIYKKGAALARNIGANEANGDVLFFPDDDSRVFEDTISLAISLLEQNDYDCIFGKTVDEDDKDSVIIYSSKSGYLSLKDYEGKFVEATMFIKKKLFLQYYYDESFGVGTFYGAEEAHDLVLRMLKEGIRLYYNKNIKIYHPRKIKDHSNPDEIKRVFTYRCGFSHLCIKHKLYYKLFKRIVVVFLYLFYLVIFQRKKMRYYMSELLGLLAGIVIRD